MVELSVCIGSACHINGANNVVMSFQHLIEEHNLHDKVNFSASFCMKKCSGQGVSVRVNDQIHRIQAENARAFFRETILPLV